MPIFGNMKKRVLALFRIEVLIVLLIFVAFSLIWIKWGKLTVYGWDLPSLYWKTTKISNAVLFFSAKDSPHLAHFIYIVPALGAISLLFLLRLRYRTANFFLFLTCLLGFALSLYMYNYMMTSKIFKLLNTGAGIHLLCGASLFGFVYSLLYISKSKKKQDTEVTALNSPNQENTDISTEETTPAPQSE